MERIRIYKKNNLHMVWKCQQTKIIQRYNMQIKVHVWAWQSNPMSPVLTKCDTELFSSLLLFPITFIWQKKGTNKLRMDLFSSIFALTKRNVISHVPRYKSVWVSHFIRRSCSNCLSIWLNFYLDPIIMSAWTLSAPSRFIFLFTIFRSRSHSLSISLSIPLFSLNFSVCCR